MARNLLELAGFALIAYGTWLLSPGWGFIIAGVLLSTWATLGASR